MKRLLTSSVSISIILRNEAALRQGRSAYDTLRAAHLLQRQALGVEGAAPPSNVPGRGRAGPDSVASRPDRGTRYRTWKSLSRLNSYKAV